MNFFFFFLLEVEPIQKQIKRVENQWRINKYIGSITVRACVSEYRTDIMIIGDDKILVVVKNKKKMTKFFCCCKIFLNFIYSFIYRIYRWNPEWIRFENNFFCSVFCFRLICLYSQKMCVCSVVDWIIKFFFCFCLWTLNKNYRVFYFVFCFVHQTNCCMFFIHS